MRIFGVLGRKGVECVGVCVLHVDGSLGLGQFSPLPLALVRQLAVFLPSVRRLDSGTLRYLPAYLLAVRLSRVYPIYPADHRRLRQAHYYPILAGQNEDPYFS